MMSHKYKIALLVVLLLFLVSIFLFTQKKSSVKDTPDTLNLNQLTSPCRIQSTCGDLVGVDCMSAADGPYYYVNKTSQKIVEYCGGFCRGSSGQPDGKYCRNCPPVGWTCSVY